MKMCEPLTASPQTSSAADSHAKTSAERGTEPASTASAVDCGANMHGSFARFDLNGSSWKTSETYLFEGLDAFSETWPRSGTMRSGIAYQRQPLAPLTAATGSGLLPTPEASNTKASAMRSGGRSPRNFLAPLWPTPTVVYTHQNWSMDDLAAKQAQVKAETRAKGKHHSGNGFGLNLAQAARLWPTPAARDYRGANAKPFADRGGGKKGEQLPNAVRHAPDTPAGGQLNPTWVEWLMGFPLGWTACMASATPSSRKSHTA